MGASVRPDPVADYLAAKGGSQTVDPVSDYLAAKGGSTGTYTHAQQIANATAPDAPDQTPDPSYLTKALGGVASLLKDVPFGETAQAGIRSIVRRQSYADALKDIQGAEAAAPSGVRNVNRVAGGLISAMAIPGSPVLQSARYGILSGLGGSAPDQTVADRLHSAMLQGTIGAAVGKIGDAGITAFRSLGAENPAANLLAKQAARAQSADRMYTAALAEGQGKAATPAIQSFLAEPDIADIVSELKQTRPFADVPADSPKMLDAVYKTLSDRAAVVKKGLDAVSPNRPNIGRFRGQDIQSAQQRLLDAMAAPGTRPPLTLDVPPETFATDPIITPGHESVAGPVRSGLLSSYTAPQTPSLAQALRDFPNASPGIMQGPGGPGFQLRGQPGHIVPGVSVETPAMRVQTAPAEPMAPVMPTYRAAVQDFAARSKEMDAIRKGYETLIKKASNTAPSAKQLTRSTPQAFAEWANQVASPNELQGAQQGLLGGVRQELGADNILSLHRRGRAALSAAPGLLRTIDPNANRLGMAGLLGIINPLASP